MAETTFPWRRFWLLAHSFMVWVAGGIVLAALISHWGSVARHDSADLWRIHMLASLVVGAVAGFLARLIRLFRSRR